MGWTSKQQMEKYPNLYGKSTKRAKMDRMNYNFRTEEHKNEVSDDTKTRNNILQEIIKRVKEGEDLDTVATEIANREEVQEQFSYYKKNGVKTPLSEIFKNWYNAKQRNKKTVENINQIGE